MTTSYKLSLHSQSLEMDGIFLVPWYVGTINQFSVRQKNVFFVGLVWSFKKKVQ